MQELYSYVTQLHLNPSCCDKSDLLSDLGVLFLLWVEAFFLKKQTQALFIFLLFSLSFNILYYLLMWIYLGYTDLKNNCYQN